MTKTSVCQPPSLRTTCEKTASFRKKDLNSILFLMTPAENKEKMDHLVSQIARFEKYLDEDAPLEDVLPGLYKHYEYRYHDYSIRQLCQEMP